MRKNKNNTISVHSPLFSKSSFNNIFWTFNQILACDLMICVSPESDLRPFSGRRISNICLSKFVFWWTNQKQRATFLYRCLRPGNKRRVWSLKTMKTMRSTWWNNSQRQQISTFSLFLSFLCSKIVRSFRGLMWKILTLFVCLLKSL